jgi:predicted O-methyltransferase YrrM
MLYKIKSYIKFLWSSKNEHGVHSPFVFDLVTKCFHDKVYKAEYLILKNYRSYLLKNSKTIKVIDFGAGSKVFKDNTRHISQIAKTAGISLKRAQLLYRMVNYFKPENILEIGTSLGMATSALSTGNLEAKITTLEGCPEIANIAQLQFKRFGFANINLIVTQFNTYLETLKPAEVKKRGRQAKKPPFPEFIYFDGNHQQKATLGYFNLLLPHVTNDSIWIFDDIHWSPEMELAWDAIRNHSKVTVSIDTYQWGIIFFRKEQVKQHFVIRV